MIDVLIIGGGIFGLSLARKFLNAGRDVCVAEAESIGAGASATPLGVLAPHAPERWNPRKQAQFDALASLPDYLRALEDETGIGTGYRRCGRLIPLTQPHHPALWRERAAESERRWQGIARLTVEDRIDSAWLSDEAAPHGAAFCGLTARIDARGYLQALAASIGAERVLTGHRFERMADGVAVFANGARIAAAHYVLAAGAETFAMLPPREDEQPAGRGEKGQAAVLRLPQPPSDLETRPILFHDGTYVVPRGPESVAVGATSERHYTDPHATDGLLEERIGIARRLSPALGHARTLERWAGLRPRAADRGLLLARHPALADTWVATGGFKTGLAMAHRLELPLPT